MPTEIAVGFDDMTVLSEGGVDVFLLNMDEMEDVPPYYIDVAGRRFSYSSSVWRDRPRASCSAVAVASRAPAPSAVSDSRSVSAPRAIASPCCAAVRRARISSAILRISTSVAWYFCAATKVPDAPLDVAEVMRRYGRARLRTLRRTWSQEGDQALWSAQSPTLRDHLQAGRGRVEFVALNRQYLQLSQLVGVA